MHMWVNCVHMHGHHLHDICLKNWSTGPVLIWQNITVVVNVVSEEILAMARLRHTISSKKVTVQKKV